MYPSIYVEFADFAIKTITFHGEKTGIARLLIFAIAVAWSLAMKIVNLNPLRDAGQGGLKGDVAGMIHNSNLKTGIGKSNAKISI